MAAEDGPELARAMPLPRAKWRRTVAQWDISHFAIPLALAAFAAMWKSVCAHYVVRVPSAVYIGLWGLALVATSVTLALYALRLVVWRGGVGWDFRNPRLVNFFFVPVILGSLLVLGAPRVAMSALGRRVSLYVLAAYQVGLSVYLYGEWLFGSALIDVVHPVVFMQVIGYFLLANIAGSVGIVEGTRALLVVGLLFWTLIFVTNFQHTSTALTQRSEKPAPTFFLFIAPPAQAAIALATLARVSAGSMGRDGFLVPSPDFVWPPEARGALYIDLFIYLVIFRVFPAFWTQKFAIVWWAYIFPLSAAASATLSRCRQTDGLFWPVLSGMLVSIATIALGIVGISTCWGVTCGRLPKNPAALSAYLESSGRTADHKQDDESLSSVAVSSASMGAEDEEVAPVR